MATIVLAVAGSFLGPVGTAIGAAIGNAIDHEVLFKPKPREGPRLTELRLQTSSYGTQIPLLFGTMRVGGTVIWSTDLIEHRSTEHNKGRANVVDYSYTASFAVAISARAILRVGRIWAEGKLLRGAAGDWKSGIGAFRLHLGGEEQAADPLIAAAEGAGHTPAHRGIAYAVFEDLELAEFGNRIPSLTFEVEADAGPVGSGAILDEIGEGAISSPDAGTMLGGFSAHGASVRAVAETLAAADGAWFAGEGGPLLRMRGSGAAVALADSGAGAGAQGQGRSKRSIAAADAAPRLVSLAHYDPARDYQIGVQRAVRPGAGWRELRVEMPAAIDAGAARAMAEDVLSRAERERERRTVRLGWEALGLVPGARVTIEGSAGLWRIERWALEGMTVSLGCVRVADATAGVAASGGRVLPAPDAEIGDTLVHCFELPPLDDTLASAPRLAAMAAGSAAGWRSAALLLSLDGGVRWEGAGRTAMPAVLGSIVEPPGWAPATLEDRRNHIEVELAHDGMMLGDADAAALASGANLALAGGELLQFARAAPLGENRWRLSRLWRGRRGTEAASGLQVAGDRFVLLAGDAVRLIELPLSALGGTASLLAEGPGDIDAVAAETVIDGLSVVPPCPAHLRGVPLPDGGVAVQWVRRSRAGWRWIDGADAPLGEEGERYRVTIAPVGEAMRIEEVAMPEAILSATDVVAGCQVAVRQLGTNGPSRAAILTIPG